MIAKAFFATKPITPDPPFERALAEHLREVFSPEERLALYNRYKHSSDRFDALIRRAILKSLCKAMGDDVVISNDVEIRNPEVIEFGTHIHISPYVVLQGWWKGRLRIGDNVWIGSNVFVDGKDVTLVGDIGIGPGVMFITSQHTGIPLQVPVIRTDHIIEPIVVEQGVDIGAGAVILPGVTIGANAIVGAGAVVNRNVPPNTVVAGVPARVIRTRGHDA